MGKTTFCLNYYSHLTKKFPEFYVALVSLSREDALATIEQVGQKSKTILLADALDEDPNLGADARERLTEILKAAADFRAVIITCRSQFFLSDDLIPKETPLATIVGRGLNQAPLISLERMYILPFGQREIDRYISKHFPIYAIWKRSQRLRAIELTKSIPDLSYRPMLLEKLPEIALSKQRAHELFDLYDLLVEGWIDREKMWIAPNDLREVSQELAYYIFSGIPNNQARIKPDEVEFVAQSQLGKNPSWSNLNARSLLNRDARGYYKFAHKSILEFLLVKMACEGDDDRPLELPWTAFMKELLVSWGYTDSGRNKIERAKHILTSPVGLGSVTPLFDMSDLSPVNGKPNFERCAERNYSEHGIRLAPFAWRPSGIELLNSEGVGIVQLRDTQMNLLWSYFPDVPGLKRLNLKEILAMAGSRDRRLPSFEQFVSLVEALGSLDREFIPERRLVLLGDKPSQNEYLLVEINPSELNRPSLRLIDRPRLVANTDVEVASYVTGLRQSLGYSTEIEPIQLWLND